MYLKFKNASPDGVYIIQYILKQFLRYRRFCKCSAQLINGPKAQNRPMTFFFFVSFSTCTFALVTTLSTLSFRRHNPYFFPNAREAGDVFRIACFPS
jgi:hypothetical protein